MRRAGGVYLDLSGSILHGRTPDSRITFLPRCPAPARTPAGAVDIAAALGLLASAARPLVIVGKGAAYVARSRDARVAAPHGRPVRRMCSPVRHVTAVTAVQVCARRG